MPSITSSAERSAIAGLSPTRAARTAVSPEHAAYAAIVYSCSRPPVCTGVHARDAVVLHPAAHRHHGQAGGRRADVRAVLPERGDAHDGKTGVRRRRTSRARARATRAHRAERLDQEVGAADQRAQGGEVVGLGRIEQHRALVGVEVAEQAAAVLTVDLVVEERAPATFRVAHHRLDLHDLGAEQAQQLRCVVAGSPRPTRRRGVPRARMSRHERR